jgi:sn-glycerol 3-phosphate transport system permease protein
MAIVLVFFFWPAGQALYQSVLQEDAFGTSSQFVGWPTSAAVERPQLPGVGTHHRRVLHPGGGVRHLHRAAAGGDGRPRGARRPGVPTLLIWPYAVAPVVAGVLWLFMFASPWA